MDMLLATAIAVVSHSLFFLAGMLVANRYNDKAEYLKKDALERQFLRLQAHADADDPCKPYKSSVPILPQGFEEQLRTNGQATAILGKRKSKPTESESA